MAGGGVGGGGVAGGKGKGGCRGGGSLRLKQKVIVEIDVKDPGFMARPKAGDHIRDGKVYP